MKSVLVSMRTVAISAAVAAGSLAGIASAATASDAEISGGVRAAIASTAVRNPADLTIMVRDGKVSLGGWARTSFDRQRAVQAALRVSGVATVYSSGVHLWSTRNTDY